jgi:hypothetical protein
MEVACTGGDHKDIPMPFVSPETLDIVAISLNSSALG